MQSKFQLQTLLTATLLLTGAARSQEMSTQHQEHSEMGVIRPEFPRFGRAQEHAQGKLFTIEEALKLALESNPTLRQAEAEIRAAKARQQQSGLYPNPTLGYTGDEIRGGSVGGGKQGFFLQQAIVTGGKLSLNRAAFAQDTKLAEVEAEEQHIRVQSAVKMAFLRVLAAQELLDARRDLAKIAQDSVETQRRLMNTGQADESEVLEAEVDAERMRMAARMQENALLEEWRSLAAVVGLPELPLATVSGDLEHGWPELSEDAAIEAIAKESPAIRIAAAGEKRAEIIAMRARREAIPDVLLRAGMEYNHETLGSIPFAKGWEGIAEASVQIPLFNRNQGNVAAARADRQRATDERMRIALTLRERAASMVDQYTSSRLMAGEYRDEILPRAKKAYGLLVEKYGQMLASYPRVLGMQGRLYELQIEYIFALESVWTSGIALQGFLLTDGLEAPARPGEVDRPIRETNVPVPERTLPNAIGVPRNP